MRGGVHRAIVIEMTARPLTVVLLGLGILLAAGTGALWARYGDGVFLDLLAAGGFGCQF